MAVKPWVTLAALLLAAAASAQVGSVEVGAGEGRLFSGTMASGSNNFYSDAVKVDDAVMKGFWLTARVTRNYELEIAVRRTPTHLTTAHGGVFPANPPLAGIDVASVEALVIRSGRIGRFAPYAGVGAGLTNLDIDADTDAIQDSNRPAISATAGARFYLLPHLGLRFDVRERATRLSGGHVLRTPEILLGGFLTFGGTE